MRNTLIIWWSQTCASCKFNGAFFDRLEQAARQQGYDVRRMEATEENLQRYRHVSSIPRYDVLTLAREATSAYGTGVALQSIANNNREPLIRTPRREALRSGPKTPLPRSVLSVKPPGGRHHHAEVDGTVLAVDAHHVPDAQAQVLDDGVVQAQRRQDAGGASRRESAQIILGREPVGRHQL